MACSLLRFLAVLDVISKQAVAGHVGIGKQMSILHYSLRYLLPLVRIGTQLATPSRFHTIRDRRKL